MAATRSRPATPTRSSSTRNGTKWTYASAGPSFFGSIAENPAGGDLWAAGYLETK
jgi:hypothetical protein